MTPPEVDQELERLFIATRAATLPTSGARERVRAAVSARLASPNDGSSALPRRTWMPWLVVGLVGLGAASLLAYRGSIAPRAASSAASPLAPPVTQPSAFVAQPEATAASASVSAEPAPAAPLGEPSQRSVAKLPPHASVAPSAAVRKSSSGAPDDELSLVRDMQAALRSGDARGTLKLAGEHARRFPQGALIEEREGLSAVARCQVAPAGDRAAILAGFLETFGRSPYAARVKAVCR